MVLGELVSLLMTTVEVTEMRKKKRPRVILISTSDLSGKTTGSLRFRKIN